MEIKDTELLVLQGAKKVQIKDAFNTVHHMILLNTSLTSGLGWRILDRRAFSEEMKSH